MDPSRLMVLLALLFISKSFSRVEGVRAVTLSKEEDLELDKQLKLLNKPPIKTIQDEAGAIFDCIDIMAQPALDHPLLKNHKIKMKPTSYPRESVIGTTSTYGKSRTLPSRKGLGCPYGTVPIRRVRKDELIRSKSLLQSHTTTIHHPLTKQNSGAHLAIVKSENYPCILYTGVEGYMNIRNPSVEGNGWSSGQMWIEDGPADDYNKIQAGWTVSPAIYGDSVTRSFIYWQGKGNKEGCYNLLCSGFIQVSKDHPIGEAFPTSKYNQAPYELPLSIYQDQNTKDWWLVSQPSSLKYGYWPKELFPHMEGGAHTIAWGGIAIRESDKQLSPQMGTGYFPDGKFVHAGYFAHMKVVNTSYIKEDPFYLYLKTYTDVPHCYGVNDYGIQEESGYSMMYGGPGGNCGG